MLLHVRNVLTPAEVSEARGILAEAPWADGRITAGSQSAQAKNNEQLPEDCDATRAVQQLLLRGLERSATFFSAALPKQISRLLFNRYAGANNAFGNHVDSAVRYLRNGAGRVRTDIPCTLFLTDPADYDGGELMLEDTYGEQRVKLPAGDLVLYPGTSVHRVEPVTRGARVASYFWIQSMVRSDEQRRLLFDMDNHLRRLRGTGGPGEADASVIGLTFHLSQPAAHVAGYLTPRSLPMKTTYSLQRAALACLITLAAGSALAQHGKMNCTPDTPKAEWRPQMELKKELQAKGWKVRQVKTYNNCYEVYGIDDKGVRAEVFFHPKTFEKAHEVPQGK